MEHFSISGIWKALTRQSPQEQLPKDPKTENLYQRLSTLDRHFILLREILTQEELVNYLQSIQPVVEKEEQLLREYPSKDKPTGWQTTDPKNHDPENFRYIVHTIINTKNDYVASLRGVKPQDEQLTRRYMGLEGFLERPFTSCTLVDEVHRGTYAQGKVPHGFILEVPEANIVAINRNDMGKPWDIQDEGEFQSRHQHDIDLKKKTPSAQDFLNVGVSEYYNEIVVSGIGPTGQKINISGIFLIVDPVLGVPLYELYTRLPADLQLKVKELRKKKFTDEDIEKMLPQLQQISQMKKQYQETKDLAELLKVPIIHIPELIHPDWYREYILNQEV